MIALRLLPALIVSCAALTAPAIAGASGLHAHGDPVPEPRTGKEALRLAKAASEGALRNGPSTGRELSPALRSLAEKLPELEGADRRRADRLLARPTSDEEANPSESTYGVPEAPPVCGAHFCVHYVKTTRARPPAADQCRNPADDRPDLTDADGSGAPDYVETMLREFEYVYEVENNQLGWKPPKPDYGRGGDNRTDVYIKNIGPEGIFGYAAPDARQPISQGRHELAAYLVMDNDYCQREYRNYPEYLAPLRVTAAHEYNHVLQFNYDAQQDNWMFESTAVWMEDKVFDEINDYRNYLPQWARLTLTPLTQFGGRSDGDDSNVKVYGDAVFTRWVDERLGPEAIRRAWELSAAAKSFGPGAYDRALRERGTDFFNVFTDFATGTAEWRAANAFFAEGSTFPDVQRALGGVPLEPQSVTRERSDYVEGTINHTSYALFDIDPKGEDALTLSATFRRGVSGAVALVGRQGDETGGNAVIAIKRLPRGGSGRVKLPSATGYSRITGVLINADTDVAGYSQDVGDWVWLADDEPIAVALNDFTKPRVTRFAPRRGARSVSTGASVEITLDEGVAGVSSRSVRLVGPGGRTVPARLSQTRRGNVVKINPSGRLAAGRRYSVKVSADVTDGAGHRLPSAHRAWRFTTRR